MCVRIFRKRASRYKLFPRVDYRCFAFFIPWSVRMILTNVARIVKYPSYSVWREIRCLIVPLLCSREKQMNNCSPTSRWTCEGRKYNYLLFAIVSVTSSSFFLLRKLCDSDGQIIIQSSSVRSRQALLLVTVRFSAVIFKQTKSDSAQRKSGFWRWGALWGRAFATECK